ncbi:Rab-GTPase-TBC domain protein [Ceratobasidium sp. AG-Ba]|nr:Rab-GTPase-TBC domain protein [Ceratobasidium sp. AG-Ba]
MHAFEEILDPSSALRVVDIPLLRSLSLQGIPEHPAWMRSRIWRLLLGALPPEKDRWEDTARKSRTRYYDVAAQLLDPIHSAPPPEYPLNARDKLLDTIAKDVDRTQPRIPFFRRPVHARQVWPTPADPSNAESKPEVADAIFDRLLLVQRVVRFGTSVPPPLPQTPEIRVLDIPSAEDGDETAKEGEVDKKQEDQETKIENKSKGDLDSDSDDQPLAFKAGGRSSLGLTPNTLSPNLSAYQSQTTIPRLQLNGRSNSPDAPLETKTHAHILLRILFVYSLLHPHHPYTQGLNELLAPLYYTIYEGRTTGLRSYTLGVHREEQVGEAAVRRSDNAQEAEEDDPTQHIEADTFWLFVELMGELGSVVGDPGDWSLPPVASGSGEGVRGVMVRLSERLRWADARLWEDMAKKSLDPRLPYFSYRWVACLLAQDLPLTALLPVWDTLLAQAPSTPETNAKIEWLLDVCVALLLGVRDRLIRAGNKRGGVGLWGEEDEEEDMPLSMIQSRPNSPIGMNGSGVAGMNEGFVQGMLLLQRYPLESVGLEWVLNRAFELGAKRAAGFGIQDQERSGGPGWGEGAWNVAAAMRERVAGWRSGQPAPALNPTSAPAEGAASTKPVPEVLVSPPAPAIAAVGDRLRQYTQTFKQSDTAASLSKASTNWSLAVMSAWNRSGGSAQNSSDPDAGSPAAPSPPPKGGRTHGHGRSDSWAGWGATAVAAAKLRAAALAKTRTPEPVPEEEPIEPPTTRQEVEWEPRRSPGDRSQSLSPTALAKVMASTQPIAPQQRSATTIPAPPTPRSAKEPSFDYEPPPRPAFFKPPRESWMPAPKTAEPLSQEEDTLSPGAIPPPMPSPGSQRYTMTLPGWSAVPPPSSPAASGAKKTGPKPLLLGKNRSSATNSPARFRGMSRQSSVSSSTGSHREWEFMNAVSPRSDSGRPDSGSFARSRRSMGTASVPTSAPGSVVPSEDEGVVIGLGLIPGGTSSDNGSPPHGASGLNPSRFSSPVMVTPAELKRTSSPLSLSAGPGSLSTGTGSADSTRGWQIADGPVTTEPAPVRKWELTDDGPAPSSVEVIEPKPKAETLPNELKHTNSTATVRKYELTDGPAPTRATTEPVKNVEESQSASPIVVPPTVRKWELSDNPVPRVDSNVPQMTADSDAADSPVNPNASIKPWQKRISSNRPTNLRVKTRPTSTATVGETKAPAADALRTPQIEKDTSVTPTSAVHLAYLRTPSPTNMEASLPQVDQPTPRRKKAGQQAPVQNRRSRVARGAARTPEVMSEEDGVKADAEDGEYEDLLSAYETETDDTSQGVGNAK